MTFKAIVVVFIFIFLVCMTSVFVILLFLVFVAHGLFMLPSILTSIIKAPMYQGRFLVLLITLLGDKPDSDCLYTN